MAGSESEKALISLFRQEIRLEDRGVVGEGVHIPSKVVLGFKAANKFVKLKPGHEHVQVDGFHRIEYPNTSISIPDAALLLVRPGNITLH